MLMIRLSTSFCLPFAHVGSCVNKTLMSPVSSCLPPSYTHTHLFYCSLSLAAVPQITLLGGNWAGYPWIEHPRYDG